MVATKFTTTETLRLCGYTASYIDGCGYAVVAPDGDVLSGYFVSGELAIKAIIEHAETDVKYLEITLSEARCLLGNIREEFNAQVAKAMKEAFRYTRLRVTSVPTITPHIFKGSTHGGK